MGKQHVFGFDRYTVYVWRGAKRGRDHRIPKARKTQRGGMYVTRGMGDPSRCIHGIDLHLPVQRQQQ